MRRFPSVAYRWWLAGLIRILTRSRLTHCAIGYDGAVLEPDMRGNRFWPLIPFAHSFPHIVCAFDVRVSAPIDLDAFSPGVPKRALPTFLRWLTRGRSGSTEDCVCTVVACLAQGGVAVPRHVVSPQHLHDWLLDNGFHHTHFEGPPDGVAGRCHRGSAPHRRGARSCNAHARDGNRRGTAHARP